jgi:tRNA G18 (ribose-2'-O)-methylase SpoU
MGRLSGRQIRMAFEKQRRRNMVARPGCHELIIVCDGLKSDFNIGKIFRSAEAFGAQVVLPKRSAFVMGDEEFGPSFTADHYPDITPIRIPMYGQVESLNVSVAASIAMYEYVRQHGQ